VATTLSLRTRESPMRPSFVQQPWLLYGLLSCSLGLNLYMVLQRPAPSGVGDVAMADAPHFEPLIAALSTDVVAATENTENGVALDVEVVQPAEHGTLDALPVDPSWTVSALDVNHSLSRTFTDAVGDRGPALSAHFARLFHWDLNLRKDLRKGDRIVVAWREGDDGIEIAAASLKTGKLRKTLTAYAWTRSTDVFSSFWTKEGAEQTRRLVESPLSDYQLVTALLRDRPNHKGMDFKAPEGTPVLATRAGRITRVNWRQRANGNCIELTFPGGTTAKYLHLSKVNVRPGQQVSAGQAMGLSGNTGRTTAPHLHYQLENGQRVIDPVDYHRTMQRAVSTGDMDAFQSDVARLDALLGNAMARR
jgi:murein DD-endopeptidase